MVTTPHSLLHTIDAYCDLVPRATADAQHVGPFTLFVSRTGWPYYARPTPGAHEPISVADVETVLARQRALDIPEQLEWIGDLRPELAGAATASGLVVEHHPLLVLTQQALVSVDGVTVRLVHPDDEGFSGSRAAVHSGFANLPTLEPETFAGAIADQARSGRLVAAGAFDLDGSPLGGGSHARRGEVSEIAGIAVVPHARRRGIGAALASALAEDARREGATTVFLSAGDDDVARVYERVGFERVGTACAAERPPA